MTDKERGLAIVEAFRTSHFFERYYGTKEAETESILNSLTERIKDIEQEPCEDAVSRKAGIDIIDSWLSCGGYNEAERHIMKAVQSVLHDLPPVSPKPKTGHWIRMKAYEKWGCSECHTVFRFTFKEHDYCPNCGIKMVEPWESEGKE